MTGDNVCSLALCDFTGDGQNEVMNLDPIEGVKNEQLYSVDSIFVSYLF